MVDRPTRGLRILPRLRGTPKPPHLLDQPSDQPITRLDPDASGSTVDVFPVVNAVPLLEVDIGDLLGRAGVVGHGCERRTLGRQDAAPARNTTRRNHSTRVSEGGLGRARAIPRLGTSKSSPPTLGPETLRSGRFSFGGPVDHRPCAAHQIPGLLHRRSPHLRP